MKMFVTYFKMKENKALRRIVMNSEILGLSAQKAVAFSDKSP
jgi:hypothetical protein